jgi:ABC-2 type transport system permease protein
MLGKILPFVLVTFVNVGLILAVARFWFQVPIAGSITQLLMLTAIFLLGSLGLGVLISNISRTQMQAMYLAAFSLMPTLILSGFIYPRETMHWIAYYAGYLSHHISASTSRGIISKASARACWPSIWPMVVQRRRLVASVLVFASGVN